MKNRRYFFIAIFLMFNSSISAQSLSESLGAVKTNFKFFSDTTELNVSDQIIILRAEKNVSSELYSAWAYGYQSYHLEFITKNLLSVLHSKNELGKYVSNYRLRFYDANNILLADEYIPKSDVNYKISSIENSQYIFSIDLIDMPIILLDKTKKINITYQDNSWF